ncbi:hypothetical protein RFI_26399 [Reticulomyxa filosa]|uniref:Uncharacterized protein n=1 Tax=Reticulomyxa filosa TaxID=46433 RepID=X6MAF4_RETFI|nr:hypothetical protein RFI_26399 [Reticulomyxa filosa]|eukprot:ETO10978.1 hypothetical protein RFI_26399 [Reticulomyxa filosa]
MQKCWKIVQTFQGLTEDTDISTLLKACQQIANKDDNGSRLPERNLRIYVCEPETNIPSISLKDDEDTKCELQKITPTVYYKDLKTVQRELLLYAQYKDKKKEFTIKSNVLVFVVPTRRFTQNQVMAEGVIVNHLLDGVKDVDTLKFATNAQKDIGSVIEKGLERSEQELKKKIQQFETTEINLSSVLRNIYIFFFSNNNKNKVLQHLLLRKWKLNYSKKNGGSATSVGQWSSWKWFEVISYIFEQYQGNLPSVINEMLLKDIRSYLNKKHSKWDLFFLTPCLNYLSLSPTNNTSGIKLSQRFEKSECPEWKEDGLDKKLISVLKTDLRIRKLEVIVLKYSEEYIIDLLVVQKDKKLSQSILEFLLLQDKDVWDHVCSNRAEKCWEVMFIVFQADFEQWSQYFEQLNKLRIFEGGGTGSSFLNQFQTNTDFIELVKSSEKFLAFLAFMQQQKMM